LRCPGAAKRGEGQSLSQRQAFALAGEWYVWYVARHEENLGAPEHWKGYWHLADIRVASINVRYWG
jgi:hypothetical protein